MMTAETLKPSHSLNSLLKGLTESLPDTDIAIEGLSLDSRHCQPGDLFMACAGENSHGLLHAADAVLRGVSAIAYENDDSLKEWPAAVAVLDALKGQTICVPVSRLHEKVGLVADRFYNHPSKEQFVIGITGTNGKTSCSQFIAEAISKKSPCGVIGTLGNGVYGKLETSTHTTPDAVSVQRLLADMQQQGANSVAMEVSSHGLEQGRVNGVNFDVAVFTNLTREHLDYHEDMESYAGAKRRLFEMPGLGTAVINVDDEYGRRLLETVPATVKTISYSLEKNNQQEQGGTNHLGCVCADELVLTSEGMRMQVSTPWGDAELRSHLLGRFNASNLLAVLSVLLVKGIGLDEAIALIGNLHTVPGRMQRYSGGKNMPLAVVDYAHTPDALSEVLTALREHCHGTLWCVFGCGGDRDRGKRPLMGAIAEKIADRIVITDDNPRSESPADIIADIVVGLQTPGKAKVEHDRSAAIRFALQEASHDDVVLVAGKGHEDYQLVGTERLPFSDSKVIESWFAEVSA